MDFTRLLMPKPIILAFPNLNFIPQINYLLLEILLLKYMNLLNFTIGQDLLSKLILHFFCNGSQLSNFFEIFIRLFLKPIDLIFKLFYFLL